MFSFIQISHFMYLSFLVIIGKIVILTKNDKFGFARGLLGYLPIGALLNVLSPFEILVPSHLVLGGSVDSLFVDII